MTRRNAFVAGLTLLALAAAPPAFAGGAVQATQDGGLMKKQEEPAPQGPVLKQPERERAIRLPSSRIEVPSKPRPGAIMHQKRGPLVHLRPVIESYQFEPGYVGGVLYATDPGVLAPGGKLTVKVKSPQNPNEWFLRVASPEFPTSYIHLADTRWIGSDTVVGTIPSNIVTPLHRVNADIFLWRTNSETSAPYGALFEVPNETRFISEADVQVEKCGRSDGDECNGQEHAGDCGGVESHPAFYGVGSNAGIHGTHKACWSVGSNTFRDSDRYRIQLANGWVFTKVDDIERRGSSPKEEIEGPTPDLPVGGTLWKPKMEWYVSDNDDVSYWMRVEIKGPKGTPHH